MVFNLPDTFLSPYCTAPAHQESNLDLCSLTHNLRIIAEETKLIFHRIHEVLLIQAIELAMFMICTKDRIHDGIIPSSLPLAYAMKGKSLSNVQLRFMINKLRNRLHEENIKVIAEVYNCQ